MPPAAVLFDLDDTLADRAAGLQRYARCFADDFGAQLLPSLTETLHATLVGVDDFGSLAQAQALCAALPWRAPAEQASRRKQPTDRRAHTTPSARFIAFRLPPQNRPIWSRVSSSLESSLGSNLTTSSIRDASAPAGLTETVEK